MKIQKKVKGFTLIELIVVLAIFMTVIVAATQLLEPVTKTMVFADVREQGEAQVSQISKYLESELSSAEFIHTANFVPTASERDDFVNHFIDTYYSGVLAKGATTDSPKYGKGTVHVMVIDNAQGGKVSEYTYENISFAPGSSVSGGGTEKEFAVNAAVYDNFSYTILPYAFAVGETEFHFTNFMQNFRNVNDTSFWIEASTERSIQVGNPQTFSFGTSATVPLVNASNPTRVSGYPVGTYYLRTLVDDETGKHPTDAGYTETYAIKDASAVRSVQAVQIGGTASNSNYGNNSSISSRAGYAGGGLCFIYSYGAEMTTN